MTLTTLFAAALLDRQTGCMLMSMSMGFGVFAMGRAYILYVNTGDVRAKWLALLGLALAITQGYWLHEVATTVEVPAAEVPLPTPESPDDHQAPR